MEEERRGAPRQVRDVQGGDDDVKGWQKTALGFHVHHIPVSCAQQAATTWDFNRIKIMSVFFFFKVFIFSLCCLWLSCRHKTTISSRHCLLRTFSLTYSQPMDFTWAGTWCGLLSLCLSSSCPSSAGPYHASLLAQSCRQFPFKNLKGNLIRTVYFPCSSVPLPLTIILLLQQLPVFQSFWFLYFFFQLATINTNVATNEFFIHNMKGSGHFQV